MRNHLQRIAVAAVTIVALTSLGSGVAHADRDATGPTPTQHGATQSQECIFEVVTATFIQFDGGESRLLNPGEQLYGANEMQSIWVFSYSDARRGWVYRDYNNLRLVGCDP